MIAQLTADLPANDVPTTTTRTVRVHARHGSDDVAERALRALSQGPAVMFAADREGVCTLWTGERHDALEARGAGAGQPIRRLFGDRTATVSGIGEMHGAAIVERALQGDPVEAECTGKGVTYEVRMRPTRSDAGSIDGVVGVVTARRDSSAPDARRAAAADEPRQRREMADRLAAVDTLAAGLANEINNPLTYTLANVEHVLRRLRVFAGAAVSEDTLAEFVVAVPSLVESLAQTVHGMQKVREVIRSLATFSRGGVESTSMVDVRGVAESSIQMAMHEVVPRARLVRSLGEVSPVMGNEAQLGQVFLNLIVNAAQSIAAGDARQHEVRVGTRMDAGRVVVEVSDTGAGIAPEDLPRIFDPFFTSRSGSRGTGLGLSVCYGTVQRLGGEIQVSSEPGRGSTFRVLLPSVSAWGRTAHASRSCGGAVPRRRVLVMDDDALIGEGIARALADVADVTTLTDPPGVLNRMAAGERWDTVFCDSSLADMSGVDVYRETLRVAPEVASRIVFMTKGAFAPHVQAFLDSIGNACLEKPFDVARIRQLVARVA